MKITLTRYMQNRTYTHGKLQIEGLDDTFETLEMAIPSDKFSYVKHCLPPRTYNLKVEASLISLGKGAIRKPWISFDKIKWFPKAGIFSNFDDHSLLSGRIFVGISSPDEWSVEQSDIVTAKIIAALQTVYDAYTDSSTEPVTLEIIESPDIEFHDYDCQQHERDMLIEQEEREKKEAEELFKELSPPTPTGGVLK